jgi:hypothetical protein
MTPDDCDWEWQKLKLDNELGKMDGDAFETRFQEIAKAAWGHDFTPTIPMGRRGDLKCDGYRTSTCSVFQCYGPRYGQMDVETALRKIDDDFRGAAMHWGGSVEEWVFVANLYRDKVPSEVVRQVQDLTTELNLRGTIWTRIDIFALARQICRNQRLSLLGRTPQPSDMIRNVTYANIGQALAFIRADVERSPLEPVALPPDLYSKIAWNLLPSTSKHFLAIGQTAAERVRQYLRDFVEPEESDRMAQGFSDRYIMLRSDGLEPAQIFQQMLIFAGGGTADIIRDTAALAIVAHFFSTCEIFDRPHDAI